MNKDNDLSVLIEAQRILSAEELRTGVNYDLSHIHNVKVLKQRRSNRALAQIIIEVCARNSGRVFDQAMVSLHRQGYV